MKNFTIAAPALVANVNGTAIRNRTVLAPSFDVLFRGASLVADVDLELNDLELAASFGFVGIKATGGNGEARGRIAAQISPPNGVSISVDDLFELIVTNPFSVISGNFSLSAGLFSLLLPKKKLVANVMCRT